MRSKHLILLTHERRTTDSNRLNEENEIRNDPIDLNERGQYRVVISGGSVTIPIDRIEELPVYMAEQFIEADNEQTPTASQQTWRTVLAKYLGEELYPGIAEGDLDPDSIHIDSAPTETDNSTESE